MSQNSCNHVHLPVKPGLTASFMCMAEHWLPVTLLDPWQLEAPGKKVCSLASFYCVFYIHEVLLFVWLTLTVTVAYNMTWDWKLLASLTFLAHSLVHMVWRPLCPLVRRRCLLGFGRYQRSLSRSTSSSLWLSWLGMLAVTVTLQFCFCYTQH